MKIPNINDQVRLRRAIPELSLNSGDTGVVRSTWFSPATAYEVEFHARERGFATRALLLAEQLELEAAGSKAPLLGETSSCR